MACSKSFQRSEDFINNVLDIVCDKILEHLPISIAAQTSVLSKRWRSAWLSLKKLNFDADFSEPRYSDWQKCSCIISSVLFHHNSPVHDFRLFNPFTNWDAMNLSQWISFLSKNGVRKIVITNRYTGIEFVDISSYIFSCSELEHLELNDFKLNPPPNNFRGFPNLKHLELVDFEFTNQNSFSTLIGSSKMLVALKLENWIGTYHVAIDAPCLQTLRLKGDFESLAFRNVGSLKSISLSLKAMPKKPITVETVDAVNLLASCCQLQSIRFSGHLCKVFSGENVGQYFLNFNYNYKLNHLRTVYIQGITGSNAELKLVEYLLAISVVLEFLLFKSGNLDIESELKMSRALMGFPRASPKARLFFLKK
ncbi:hypothetical protein KSS87_013810 [Heliosperma pusillum]|nr:hypothetical protein KSS87_013810 [Heliosperma pusillum]